MDDTTADYWHSRLELLPSEDVRLLGDLIPLIQSGQITVQTIADAERANRPRSYWTTLIGASS